LHQEQKSESARRVLAVDVGIRRSGIAVSDALGVVARPLEVIEGCGKALLERVAALVNQLGVAEVVIGHPGLHSGQRDEVVEAIEGFAGRLRQRVQVPVRFWDETLSSWEAERGPLPRKARRGDFRRRRKAARALVDARAAAVVLQDYLDARARGAAP